MEEQLKSPVERLAAQLDFETGAYTTLSVIGTQLGWDEEEFQSALSTIDIQYLKSKFIGSLLTAYTDEELEKTLTALETLQRHVEKAIECIPEALNKYLEEHSNATTPVH